MQIYIMRHGEAQGFMKQVDDSQRTLTVQGELEVKTMANWLQKMNIKPMQVFVSPYVRAQQTCAIATSLMETTITTLEFITPEDDAKQVHDFIDGWCHEHMLDKKVQSLLIISHMPLVSYLVAELTQSSNAPIFATAGIAQIDYDTEKMQGTLQRLVSPMEQG